MELLIINGHDYSQYVERKGYGWSRNDLDSENTTRNKAGRMRRDKITTKRKLTYKVIHMTRAELANLDDDLSIPTFQATYLDLHGKMTREFYCSSFSTSLFAIYKDTDIWVDASFTMTEV